MMCAACGRDRSPGELLLVLDRRDVRSPATVCRPSTAPECIAWAGDATQTTLALFDADAARAVDRLRAGSDRLRRAEADARALNDRRAVAYG
jgi:hypothetical protein